MIDQTIIDQFFRFFLSFSHERIIVPIIILGYIWLDRKFFFQGICLLLINMLWNLALKATFQIPLSSKLGKAGFAFPSGHMQNAIVLYGWLFNGNNKTIIKISILFLLLGICLGLIHFGYHNWFDIGGAIFFGISLVFIYNLVLQHMPLQWLSISLLICSTSLIIYIALVYEIKPYVWLAYYALIGLLLAEWNFGKLTKPNIKNTQQKIIATILYILSLCLINWIFSVLTLPTYLWQLKWLFLGYFLPFMVFIATKFKRESQD